MTDLMPKESLSFLHSKSCLLPTLHMLLVHLSFFFGIKVIKSQSTNQFCFSDKGGTDRKTNILFQQWK